jgi:hypothetical protein
LSDETSGFHALSLNQHYLTYSGVFEALKMHKSGFPFVSMLISSSATLLWILLSMAAADQCAREEWSRGLQDDR